MSSIPEVTLGNWTAEVLQSDRPVLVDFYSPTCGPCRMQTPVLEELAIERSDLKIVKVDVTENPELAVHHQIAAVPTLLLVMNGQVVDRLRGLQNRDRLLTFLENTLWR